MGGKSKATLTPEQIAQNEFKKQQQVAQQEALQKLTLLQEAQVKSAKANTAAIGVRNSKEGTAAVGQGAINLTAQAITNPNSSLGSNNILGV